MLLKTSTLTTLSWLENYLEFEHNIYIYVLYLLIIIAAGWAIKGIETLVKKNKENRIKKED